jgi:hypothetical protein
MTWASFAINTTFDNNGWKGIAHFDRHRLIVPRASVIAGVPLDAYRRTINLEKAAAKAITELLQMVEREPDVLAHSDTPPVKAGRRIYRDFDGWILQKHMYSFTWLDPNCEGAETIAYHWTPGEHLEPWEARAIVRFIENNCVLLPTHSQKTTYCDLPQSKEE